MVRNEQRILGIITPETQYANLKGVLNNNINAGTLNPDNPENSINNLYDVNISDLKKNDILVYNGISWVNKNYAEPAKDYVWRLYGGDSDGFTSENNPDDNPEIPIEKENYAEKFVVMLNNFINSNAFQESIKGINSISNMNMENNIIYLNVNNRINGLLEMFYNNEEINTMIGKIISVIYDNVSYGLRNAFDEIGNDVNDNILNWKIQENLNNSNKKWENKIFIYFSDSSGLFLDLRVNYI